MNTNTRTRLVCIVIAAFGLIGAAVQAQDTPATQPPTTTAPAVERPAVEAPDTPDVEATNDAPGAATDEPPIEWTRDRARRTGRNFNRNGDELVSFAGSSTLPAGERADEVVSIFGSSTSSGEVRDAIVSVFGNTRVEGGSVGDAAVAVLGDNYVNATVDGNVVAVLGDVELGPKADVRGSVVVVGGELKRDPAARVRGGVQHVMSMPTGALTGLRAWLENCARYFRPLAFAPGLGWAWTIALGFLALYAFLGLMFREPVDRCVKTLQEHPGQTVLASLLAMLLTPVLFVVLCITVIGIAFIPIASFGIFLATLFGKAVVLAWIGRSLFKLIDDSDKLHSALAVLAGGAAVLLLYTVPVLGFLVFKLLGLLAFGVVVYTLLLEAQARRRSSPPPAFASGGGPRVAPSTGGAAFAAAGAGATGEAYTPPPAMQPAVNEAFTLPRAGFWIRMLALLIDVVLVAIVFSVLSDKHQMQLIAIAAYGAIMWKLKGTTVGGIVCNLKVVRVDGRPIDWSTAIVRALSCFLSLVVCGLGFIWIAFDDGKQSWHDKIAGTAVVRAPQGVSLL